jgi:Na+/glutamate symporter
VQAATYARSPSEDARLILTAASTALPSEGAVSATTMPFTASFTARAAVAGAVERSFFPLPRQRIVGRDYEGAIMSAAFCGFAMGATATAIANMQALAKRHGPAPQAFLIVPIVGAFFIDIVNAIVLTLFLSLAMMGFS